MADKHPDIVIFGAGIAGLWTFNRLKRMGYDVLLLEREAIGGGQTIASQGIIHSGLKYAFAGRINKLAKSISAMPDLWRAALNGEGPVDLSAARDAASSQYLMIPSGLMGGLVKLVTGKALERSVTDIKPEDWPEDIKRTGFNGSVIYMDEPVLEVSSVIRALSEPYKDCIRRIDDTPPMDFLRQNGIQAKQVIFTSAASNHVVAKALNHDKGLKTQVRPLLMGMIKPAPYPLYAHLVGTSDKPVATITTHKTEDGDLVWYLGGGVAERAKDANPDDVYNAVSAGFSKYLPDVDLSEMKWAVLPIDRIEGKSDTQGWMPDTPTVHETDEALYCWPTKLTFAPMLSDMIVERLDARKIVPSGSALTDWSFLPQADYAKAPWDKAEWVTQDE